MASSTAATRIPLLGSRSRPSRPAPAGGRAVERIALLGVLIGLFGELHPALDQWGQRSVDARLKDLHGRHLVHLDGTPADGQDPDRADEATTTADALGRRHAALHVAAYTAGQFAAAVVATRALGYRVPVRALLAGAAVNGATHLVIDRREPLLHLARWTGHLGYVEHCTAARVGADGVVRAEPSGPGSALFELDQSLHRAIGVAAAVATTWLATRSS
ncbi:hypothetical protein [Kitasatospora sp. NPDC088134]|uniref:hypothetical protein n=1 Tax=Kitasatospora sp. NPDC088134 TaxID=3364071 RepID=UPI003813B757